MGKEKFNAEKKENGTFKKKKVRSDFFFQTGRWCFNIFVTFLGCFGGYPRARGCVK
jgi:hypothetical protein